MGLASHRGIILILFGRSAILSVCLFQVYLFVPFHSLLLKKCFRDHELYEAVKSTSLAVQLKFKCLLMKPTQDDVIKAIKFTVNCLLKEIKGSYCCVVKVCQYMFKCDSACINTNFLHLNNLTLYHLPCIVTFLSGGPPDTQGTLYSREKWTKSCCPF